MDAPESPPAGRPSSAAAATLYEDSPSPVFDFINSLSPIATAKRLNSAQNVQLFKSSDLAPVSSIFTSPQVNPQKESKLTIRDGYFQLSQGSNPNCQRSQIGTSSCIELSGSETIASENCSPSEDATSLPSKCPQSILLGSETLGDDKRQNTDGITVNVEQVKLSSTCSDQNGLDQMDSSTSVRNVQENEVANQYNDDLAACNLSHLITHCGTGSTVMSKSDLSSEAQPLNWELRSDDVISSKSFMPMDKGNLEDSRRKFFDGSTGCYIQSAADDNHVYCAAAGGVATNYDPAMLPGGIQSSNNYFFDALKVPSDDTLMENALSQHQCGTHRCSLFNEKVGASDTSIRSVSNLHHTSICGDNYLKPVGSSSCPLPGIGLHLNAVASNSSNNMPFTINPPLLPEHSSPATVVSGSEMVLYSSEVYTHIQDDHSSQKIMPNAEESGQESHKEKRRKLQNGDGDSCRHCCCKKSKCLKLYCACFAAKVYCSEFCSCQGCLNNHTHEETVLCIRKRTESRNPLAFAPTVTRTCGSGPDFGDNSNKTPASARHKRGCNCRKSSCLKKYCECFQSGVGCSISCRCESCKNSFGRREEVQLLTTEKVEKGGKEKSARAKEEKLAFDKQHMVGQSGDLPFAENVLTTPSVEPCRSSVLLPSTCSKPPLSSAGCTSRLHNSQSPMKADVLLSPFEKYSAEMILGNGSSDIQEAGSSCTTSVKVVSPNKKRVSPLRIGAGLSPMGRTGRKLVLKSIPSFPSLTGDVDSEPH